MKSFLLPRPQLLTELIKVCVHAIRSGDGAHESGFQKGGPLIGQAPQPTYIILQYNRTYCNESTAVQRGHVTHQYTSQTLKL